MSGLLLRLRWSWRDLRARWLQVAAIATVIGIGSGVYSGLSSTSEWRRVSYDRSYEQTAMWDLHVELAEGPGVPADALLAAVRSAGGPDVLHEAETRLVVATQVDASDDERAILVPGRLVGVRLADGAPRVARLAVREGRSLGPTDLGEPIAVLEEHFADHYGLPASGRVRVAGDVALDYVGRVLSPEYFIVIPPRGTVFGEANFAVLWASLETVQTITGREGLANSAVLTVAPGTDVEMLGRRLAQALDDAFPGMGFTITRQDQDPGLRTLYDDIEGDQRFNNVFAVLILLGAAFAAFNLTGRIVESQRREIGIGMALGAAPWSLAARPLLIGTQIALVGVVAGVLVGFLIQRALASVLESVFPMPVWITDFQPGVFLRGAALGLLIPLVATVLPVVRAVRVAPVDAIRTTHRATSGGLAPLLQRMPLPGRSLTQLPFRNVLRAPRRSLLTALGIAAAITTLVGVVGMMDSYFATLDRSEQETLGQAPDRMLIDIELAPVSSDAVRSVLGSPFLAAAEPRLHLGGVLEPDRDAIDLFLTVGDLTSELWAPTPVRGAVDVDTPGIVISRKAAADLGIGVGDPVVLRHPRREGAAFRLVDTELPVLAVHPDPFRFVAFVDLAHAGLFGLEGFTNAVQAVPAAGVSVDDAIRGLFGQAGVVSVQPVDAQVAAVRDRIEEFLAIFTIVQVAVLVLALLIAFNASNITLDERRREHATMFAFGVPVARVLRVGVIESLVTGVAGTVLGLAAGRLLVGWLTTVLLADTLPDIEVLPTVAVGTILTALVLGTIAVTLAPVLTVRRLLRMDIPSTLRVME